MSNSPRGKAIDGMRARKPVACSNCGRDTKSRDGVCGKCAAGHNTYATKVVVSGGRELEVTLCWDDQKAEESRAVAAIQRLAELLPIGQSEPATRNDPPVEFKVPAIGKAKRKAQP